MNKNNKGDLPLGSCAAVGFLGFMTQACFSSGDYNDDNVGGKIAISFILGCVIGGYAQILLQTISDSGGKLDIDEDNKDMNRDDLPGDKSDILDQHQDF